MLPPDIEPGPSTNRYAAVGGIVAPSPLIVMALPASFKLSISFALATEADIKTAKTTNSFFVIIPPKKKLKNQNYEPRPALGGGLP
jgi:hypothetical protein